MPAVVRCISCFQFSALDHNSIHDLYQQVSVRLAENMLPSAHYKAPLMYIQTQSQSLLSHQPKHKKMEWEEVKGIEWVAVGEKDGERGRGRVGVSGTRLSV